MKAIRSIIAGMITAGVFLFWAAGFVGCSQQSPTQALESVSHTQPASFAKKGKKKGGKKGKYITSDQTNTTSQKDAIAYPQSGSLVLNCSSDENTYYGGMTKLLNGSYLTVFWGALTPPKGTKKGADVEITFNADLDPVTQSLQFDLGPSGCQFDPPAMIWLSYKDLGNGTPTLYYIDDKNNWVEQQPDMVDLFGMMLLVKIHHFSRYAIAFSR